MENIKRQGLSVSAKDLRILASDIEMEYLAEVKSLGIMPDRQAIVRKKFIVPIINKTPECSDTWEIEYE